MRESDTRRLPYIPEWKLSREGIDKVGVVTLIVREGDGHIYLVEEREQRETTGKLAGTVNPPCETRKAQRGDYGELIAGNVQACLADELGISDVHPERRTFLFVDRVSYRGRYRFPVPLSQAVVHADAVQILYTGSREVFTLQNPEEVMALGFFSLESILADERLRPGVRNILFAAHRQRWVDDLLDNSPVARRRFVFPDNFSIQAFLAKRDHPTNRDTGE